MSWKDKSLTAAALVFSVSFSGVWYSLLTYGVNGQGALLALTMIISSVSGGVLAVHQIFDGKVTDGPRRGLTSGEMAAARFLENERRLDMLESSENRFADLEARLEFAERLLANQERHRMNQPPALPNRTFEPGSRPADRTRPQTPQP
jgi:hypothetical protein